MPEYSQSLMPHQTIGKFSWMTKVPNYSLSTLPLDGQCLNVFPLVFHQMSNIFSHIEGVEAVVDDIVIWARTMKTPLSLDPLILSRV